MHNDVKPRRIAAVRPPPSLPANSQFFRPGATGSTARSPALLSLASYPASVDRFNAARFDRA